MRRHCGLLVAGAWDRVAGLGVTQCPPTTSDMLPKEVKIFLQLYLQTFVGQPGVGKKVVKLS